MATKTAEASDHYKKEKLYLILDYAEKLFAQPAD